MEKKITDKIALIYFVLICIFIIFQGRSVYFNIQFPFGTATEYVNFLLIIEIVGTALFIISNLYIYKLETYLGPIIGIIGCVKTILIYTFIRLVLISYVYAPIEYHPLFPEFISNIEILYIFLIFFCLINIFVLSYRKYYNKKNIEENAIIRRTILDFCTKYTRLEIKEIAEESKIDRQTIIGVVKDMIKNEEIYAHYFKSTHMVVFNQQANIVEIDKLMESYKEWEEKQFGKK